MAAQPYARKRLTPQEHLRLKQALMHTVPLPGSSTPQYVSDAIACPAQSCCCTVCCGGIINQHGQGNKAPQHALKTGYACCHKKSPRPFARPLEDGPEQTRTVDTAPRRKRMQKGRQSSVTLQLL